MKTANQKSAKYKSMTYLNYKVRRTRLWFYASSFVKFLIKKVSCSFHLTGLILFSLLWVHLGAQERIPNPRLEKVVVVFKTHFDIGYTDYAESVVRKYGSSMIEGALHNLDAGASLPPGEQFSWTLPGWPMQQILDRANPENTKRVEQALKTGRFAIHALPFTLETEASDLENIVRGFQFSGNISRRYGLELPRDAKMTDVPSHSWALPTLLKNAGIDFLHLGCNPASQSPDVPLLFWWEGPDGSRLMTMYYPDYYGTDLVSPEDWPFKTWLAIIPTNDNQGAPPPDQVRQTLEEIKKLAPHAEIITGRMSDFYDALIRENPELPVIKGDMPDTWIHGYQSMPREMKTSRKMQKDIYALEALNTQLNNWTGVNENIRRIISKASENSLLFDEHTFGLAMSHGHSGTWAYGDEFRLLRSRGIYQPIEKSWQEKGDRIYEAERKIMPNYKDELERLATAINTDQPHITVYNPLPWKRSGLVHLQMHAGHLKGNALKDAATGAIIPLTEEHNVFTFPAENVPPMGYKTYFPVEEEIPSGHSLRIDRRQHKLENEYFEVQVDPGKGRIVSIIDKKSGRQLVRNQSSYGFGNYFYERFSKKETDAYAHAYIKGGWNWAYNELGRPGLDDTPYFAIRENPARITWKEDPLKVQVVMHFDQSTLNPHNYSILITLYQDKPYIELDWAIHSKPAEPWPEAGWIPFSLNVSNPSFKAGRLGAVVDPVKDFVPGSNFDYFFLNSGIAVVDPEGNGVGIASPDVPGISLDRPGLWKYSGTFTPEEPNVFFNLFNNQWSTNFTEWIEGSWQTHFFIWSVDDYQHEKDLITPSEEFRSPLKAAFSEGVQGTLPLQNHGVALSRKGVLVTAFGSSPYGKGTLLRCWEQAGNNGECTISLPGSGQVREAWPVNLRGEPAGEKLRITDNQFTIQIKAWKPYSFILK